MIGAEQAQPVLHLTNITKKFGAVTANDVSLLLEGALKDPLGMGWPKSARLIPEARLPRIVEALRLHWGFALALIAALAVWVINAKTTLGFEMRAVGQNPDAARFAGIPVGRVILKTALLSGGLAALAEFSEVSGLKGSLTLDLLPGFGYAGIVVAMLALLRPLGVVVAALSVAAICVGAAAIRIASPLIFATMGELISKRAGVLNLGIEGIMVADAFAGWISVWAGAAFVGWCSARGVRAKPSWALFCLPRLMRCKSVCNRPKSGWSYRIRFS